MMGGKEPGTIPTFLAGTCLAVGRVRRPHRSLHAKFERRIGRNKHIIAGRNPPMGYGRAHHDRVAKKKSFFFKPDRPQNELTMPKYNLAK